jgi:linoleoyl-CoA desaturase
MTSRVKFISPEKSAFFSTLRQRVNQYFKENNISRYGNQAMFTKTIILLGIYLAAYVLMLLLPVSAWLLLPLAVLMGVAKSGVGMSVMHDALHGSYSSNQRVNKWMGRSIYMLGANPSIWKIQHNILHHTYTNIPGMDEDINTKVVIRLSDQTPLKSFHRYQHIYTFLLYSLMTLKMLTNDFTKILNYRRTGMLGKERTSFSRKYLKMVSLKVIYLFILLALPVLLTSLLWWQVLIGFLVMHFTAGFILSTIFQLAHIVEEAHQPMPNEEGNIENAWAIHQLQTTANFAPKNRLLNWYVGGLNYQIEHHLFPHICHIHYRKIADIVQQTAREFHLDYHVQPTFRKALGSHVRKLKALGTQTQVSPQLKMANQ